MTQKSAATISLGTRVSDINLKAHVSVGYGYWTRAPEHRRLDIESSRSKSAFARYSTKLPPFAVLIERPPCSRCHPCLIGNCSNRQPCQNRLRRQAEIIFVSSSSPPAAFISTSPMVALVTALLEVLPLRSQQQRPSFGTKPHGNKTGPP